MNSSAGRYNHILLLACIIAIGIILRIPFFSVPPERDEGMYATAAQIVMDGGLPYKDVALYRMPGIFYIYSTLFKIFGDKVEAIRFGSAFFAMLAACYIFKLSRALYNERVGLVAAFLYVIFSSGPMIQGSLGNTETFMILPLVLSTYYFYTGWSKSDNANLFLGGLFSGLAFLIKEAALPNFLLFLFCLIFFNFIQSKKLKDTILQGVVISIGFSIPIITVFSYLIYKGLFNDFMGIYRFAKGYGTYDLDLFLGRLIGRGVYSLGKEYSFLWLASVIVIMLGVLKERAFNNVFAILWIVFSFVGVCLGSFFWPHYFIQMIPSLSIAAAYGSIRLYEVIKEKTVLVKIPSIIYALILFSSLVYGISVDYKFYLKYTPEEISFNMYGGDIFIKAREIALYIKERTDPSDFIYQNRWDSEIYFIARRKSPTKFIAHQSFNAVPNIIEAMNELRNDILNKEPKYIVWYPSRPGEVPEFVVSPIVKYKYELETEINGVKIFRLKGWKGKDKNNA